MKAFKKILSLMLAVCMLMSVLSLASCKKDDDPDKTPSDENAGNTSENTYTVTVVDGANNPVAGVTVMIDPSYKTYTSDANGKITFESEAKDLKAMILASPDGYEHSSDVVAFKSGEKTLTLTVTKLADATVTYKVKVVDQDGNPVPGVLVQLCYNGVCLTGVSTDANGEITQLLKSGYEVTVKLEVALGSNYILPAPDANGYHASIPADETEITITIIKN